MTITLTLPETIGPSGGPRSDGVYRGEVGYVLFDQNFSRNFAYTSGKYYTIDTNGGADILDVTANTDNASTIQLFPTSGSGNLSVGDYLEFALTKADFDSGHRIAGLHINLDTASANITYNIQYFATDDTWKNVTNLTGGTGFLGTLGDNHVTFDVPTDHQSLVHTFGSTVDRIYPFRIVIDTLGVSPVAPTATRIYIILQNAPSVELTTVVQAYDIISSLNHITTGDHFDHVGDQSSAGIEFLVWEAQVGGGNTLQYWNGTSFVDVPSVTDPSTGLTRKNDQVYVPVTLTASQANAEASTTVAIEEGGYVEANFPSATDVISICLCDVNNTATEWMIGINASGNIVVTEDGVVTYTHATLPTANTIMRVWLLDGQIRFYVGDDNVYTSTSTPTDSLLAKFEAVTNGAIVNDVRFVQFEPNEQDATPITIALKTGSTFAQTNGTSTTIQFPARYRLTFSTPTDWVSNTAANSPNDVAGFHLSSEKTGIVTQAVQVLYVRGIYDTGNNALGLDFSSSYSFTHVALKCHDFSEWTEDVTFELVNLDTGQRSTVTLPFLEAQFSGESDDALSSTFNIGANQRLMVKQTAGRANQYVGNTGDLILS